MKPVILVPVFLFARALAADGDAGGSRQSLKAAVGDVSQLPPIERAAFSDDATAFKPLAKPGPNDWLAHHREEGQTFAEFQVDTGILSRNDAVGRIHEGKVRARGCRRARQSALGTPPRSGERACDRASPSTAS
ncbi:MAG: hypothetical protein K1X78_05630 [Verrucomicrobiaceae bacterium]|nr:hypothetical protein [Verrucomicrobiaceae bacterium]